VGTDYYASCRSSICICVSVLTGPCHGVTEQPHVEPRCELRDLRVRRACLGLGLGSRLGLVLGLGLGLGLVLGLGLGVRVRVRRVCRAKVCEDLVTPCAPRPG